MFGNSNTKPGDFQCDTLISNKTTLVGDVHFSGGLHVDGCVKGNLIAEDGSNAVVRISEQGRVEGEIRSPRAIVNGYIAGNMFIDQHVELAEKAKVDGDIHYTAIQMVMGAQVNGHLVHEARLEAKGKRGTSNVEPLSAQVSARIQPERKAERLKNAELNKVD